MKGAALIYTLLTVGVILGIVLFLSAIFASKLRLAFNFPNSVTALYAADSGIEWQFYNTFKDPDANQPTLTNGATFTVTSPPIKSIGKFRGISRAIEANLTVTPPTGNLIAYWKLNESSGVRNDSWGNNHLTDNNGVLSATGKQGQAALFNSALNQYLSIPNNSNVSVGNVSFTVAGWVYFNSISHRTIVSKWSNGLFAFQEYLLYYDVAVNRFRFFIGNAAGGSQSIDANNFGAATPGNWYFVVAWVDTIANTINIQVNNGTVNSLTKTVTVGNGPGPLQLGAIDVSGHLMDGRLDEVGLWERILNTQERSNLWNNGDGSTL